MSLTFEQIRASKTNTKFFSKSRNKIISRNEIFNYVLKSYNHVTDILLKQTTLENEFLRLTSIESQNSSDKYIEITPFKRVQYLSIPKDLEIIEKVQIIRDGKIHNFECEFAIGTHCHCWCGEEFHGLMGAEKISKKERCDAIHEDTQGLIRKDLLLS